MIYTLEHNAESPVLVIGTQIKRIHIFRNITITDERFVAVVNKTVLVHIAILQVTHFYITTETGKLPLSKSACVT